MAQRTLSEKTEDIKRTFTQFQELLTPQSQTDLLDKLTGTDAQLALAQMGNPVAYAEVVRSSIDLQSLVAANNRTALLAAVQANAGSPARPQEE